MTRPELVKAISEAIGKVEGFYLPRNTLAKRQANPGNIRRWKDASGKPYPVTNGFVNFVDWADGDYDRAIAEGWRILRVLVDRYVAGQYTGGKSPTLRQMFHVYAPASDNNAPDKYAETVAKAVGISPDVPLESVIS